MTICPLFCTSWLADWALLLPPSLTCLEDLLSLFSTLSKTHIGYLQLVRAFLRWSFSFWSNSGLLHTVEALWERVWMTLNLAERWWWLSHCKYWSVCVGFPVYSYGQRTINLWFNNSVQKGMEPSSLLSSTVNLMAGSTLFMCCRKPCLLTSLWMTKVSSTYLCQNLGGGGSA